MQRRRVVEVAGEVVPIKRSFLSDFVVQHLGFEVVILMLLESIKLILNRIW